MGHVPLHLDVNNCVVPPMSCWANKRVPQKPRGTTDRAKSFKKNSVTTSEMWSPQHRSLRLQTVIFAPFSLVFFGNMGYGPLRWAVNHCVVPLVSC